MAEIRLIRNYGHVCTLPVEKDNRSLLTRIVDAFQSFFIINELNPRAFKYCRSQFEFKQEKKKHLEGFTFKIHPFSTFRTCWEIFMTLISLFSLLFSPYIATFTLFPHISLIPKWKTNLIFSLDLICILDIILNFRTCFYDIRRQINHKTTTIMISWIARDDLWNSSQLMIYSTGLMRTACIMSNSEYEANEHQTTEDQLVMCIMWILTGVLLTLLISFLIQITRSIISSQTKYKEMVLQLKQYMHHKQLSAHTQNRLINYYEFRFQRRFFRDEEILSMISGHLRQEIRRHKCQKLVENVPFFQGLPQFLLIRIISCLQLEIFLTHDVIIKGKTRGTSMYFIASGTVAVYSETGREIYHRYDGQHFGETSMIRPDILRIATVVATEPCELYRLDRKDFFNIIQPFPELLAAIEQRATESLHDITAIDDKHRQCHIDKYKNKPNII